MLKIIKGTTPGSQLRRLLSYVVLVLFGLLVIEAIWATHTQPWFTSALIGQVLVIIALFFFFVVCVGVIFLSSQDFRPDPARLARDSVLSIGFSILSFAVLFRQLGFSLDETCAVAGNHIADSIYFSAVTFSTLGYGDFRPCEGARLWAATEAIVGNLHLGLIVGTAFLFIQNMQIRDKDL